MDGCWIILNAFSTSTGMAWFFSFSLLMWWMTLIDFWKVKLCIPGMQFGHDYLFVVDSLVKPLNLEFSLWVAFSIKDQVSFIGLFIFHISWCACFGELYFSNSMSTSSKLQMYWHQVLIISSYTLFNVGIIVVITPSPLDWLMRSSLSLWSDSSKVC